MASQQNQYNYAHAPLSDLSFLSSDPEVGEIQKVLLTLYDLYKDGAMSSEEHRMFKKILLRDIEGAKMLQQYLNPYEKNTRVTCQAFVKYWKSQ